MFKLLANIIIFFLGGAEPKGNPKTVVQRKKIERILRSAKAYRKALMMAQDHYVDLIEEFGIEHDVAEQWAESVIKQTDLIENMEREVSEALGKIQAEIDVIEASTPLVSPVKPRAPLK